MTGAAKGDSRGVFEGSIPPIRTNCNIWCVASHMYLDSVERLIGRHGFDQADVALRHRFGGQNRLRSRSAVSAMKTVDCQRRMKHRPVVEPAIRRCVELCHPGAFKKLRQVER